MISAKIPVIFVAVAGLGLTACTTPEGTPYRTGTGALAGAGAGAIAGRVIGGDTRSAVIGGIAGAALGAGIGNQLDRQAAALEAEIGGSGARIINTGTQLIVSLPEAITFPVDSAQVKGSLVDDLYAIAENLQQYPNSTIRVIGHTDNTGTAAYNQDLSERRAAAVASILRQGGVSSRRIRTIGMGEEQPIASNATAAGRQQNRRVEIVITPNA